jgi:hypothetical protein
MGDTDRGPFQQLQLWSPLYNDGIVRDRSDPLRMAPGYFRGETLPTSAAVENILENVYRRQCQMNLRHLKSMFPMRLI